MSEINFDSKRESKILSSSSGESSEGSYQNYRRGSLPKGYTPYPRQVNENEYDRYDPNYEGAETPDRERNEKTCCDIGRLSFVTVHSMLESVITELNFLKNFFNEISLLKEYHWRKVKNIVRMQPTYVSMIRNQIELRDSRIAIQS